MIEQQLNSGILTLRLAHGTASALDVELCDAIGDELRAAAKRADVRAVILTGTGSIFSAGVDLFRLTEEGRAYVERFYPALVNVMTELFRFPKPLVAAANGHAIAGGALLVSSADYRLMSGGKIGAPELLVGVPFPAIAIETLRFAVGPFARELALTGKTVGPDEARAKGLIDEVVEPERLMERAHEIATQLATVPADVFWITKQQLRSETEARVERIREHDVEGMKVWSSPETHARIRDYLARTVRKK